MRTIIPGPPGTGKTHTLIHKHLKHELIDLKTDPKKIAYISFSNAAAKEAKKRIQDSYPQFEFEYISTMHAMGKRELGIDTNTQLLQGKNWNAFKNYSKVCDDLYFENKTYENGYREYTNPYMKVIEYSKAKQIDVMEAAYELELDLRI